MPELARHLAYLHEALQAAADAPLSIRKAMLVASLADAYADRLFAAQSEIGDVSVFRAALAASSPSLAAIFDLCSWRGGARLALEAVSVPIADYPTLPVEEFMISVYSGHTVQRLRLVHPDGRREDAHRVLAEAVRILAEIRP